MSELEEFIGIRIGEASVLFGIDGKSEFDSIRAKEIIQEIMAKIEQDRQELIEVVRFYANAFENCKHRTIKLVTYATSFSDDNEAHEDAGYKLVIAGKRAREVLKKMGVEG